MSRFIAFLSLPLIFLLSLLSEFGIAVHIFVVPVSILLYFCILKYFRNVQVMLIIMLYIVLYFLYLIPHFYFGIQLSQYVIYNETKYYEKVVLMFYSLFCGILLGTKGECINSNKDDIFDLFNEYNSDQIKFCVLLFLNLGFLLLTFRQGVNVLGKENSYELYINNLQSVGAASLFALIPLFLLGISIKNRRKRIICIGFFVMLYCIFALTRGLRMVLVPYVVLYFLLCFDQCFSNLFVFILGIVGLIGILVINMIKAQIQMDVTNLLGTGNDVLISHHSDMLYIASSIFGLFDDKLIGFDIKNSTFVGLFLESFIPPSLLPDMMKYPHALAGMLPNGGGCLFLIVLYISFGGYLGIILFGYILSRFICFTYEKKQIEFAVLFVMIMTFSTRWISYDFHVILRFPLLALISFVIFNCDYSRYIYKGFKVLK